MSSEDDSEAFVVGHALSATSQKGEWIIDSGATCHMCTDKKRFSELNSLRKPQEVTLGDGNVLQATAEGTVPLKMLLPDGNTKKCTLRKVPKLTHNLLSVSKAGKTTKFDSSGCQIMNHNSQIIAFATRVGNLYCLEVCHNAQQLNVVEKDRLWHRRYGHLNDAKSKE